MTSRVGSWFWKRLGGQVDDDGELRPDDEDPLVIFSGTPERARRVKDQLEAHGFEVVANARVADPRGLAVDLGVSPRPSDVQLEIRSADYARATAVLDSENPSL
jgi:hypothetical protein